MSIPLSYLSLDPETHWFFYRDDFRPMSEADRRQIRPLDEASSRAVWDRIVGQPVPATGLAEHGWLPELCAQGTPFEWQEAWNAGDDYWAQCTLRPHLNWPDEAPVLFVAGPTWSFETTLAVFLRCWRAFLLADDEGPLLASLEYPEVVRFHPTGSGRIGRRLAS